MCKWMTTGARWMTTGARHRTCYADFDPRVDYPLTITPIEMTTVEREAQAESVEDIELDL